MFRLVRQGERESRPLTYHRRYGDFTSQPFDNCFTDRQSESRPLRIVVQLGKTFEHTSYLLQFDARTGISHMENDLIAHQFISVADVARLREFECVTYQIREHLEYPVLVSLYHQSVFGWLVDQLYPLRRAEYVSVVHLFTQAMDIYRCAGELDNARFDLRKIKNLVDQLQQTFVVGFDNLIIRLAFFRILTFGYQMREADDGIQRCTYLMTHIGEESRLQFVGHFGLLFGCLKFPFDLFQLRDVPFDADDDGGGKFVTVHPYFSFVQDDLVPVFIFPFRSPVQTLSGGGDERVFLSFLFCHFGRVVVEVVFADRVPDAQIPVVRFPVAVDISEIVVDLLDDNSGGEVVDGGIHDQVEPFDLRFVVQSLGYVV